MYLKTPKRYRPGRQPRRVFNFRWLWLWLLTPLVAYGGYQLYQQREQYQPMVSEAIGDVVESVGGSLATAAAPTPTPRPDPSQALAVADGSWGSGAIEEALTTYEDVLADIPNDSARHTNFALGLVMDGRAAEGAAAAERAVNADPYNPQAWAVRAYALADLGEPTQAIASALQALSYSPENPSALAYLANAYFEGNQIELARTTVDRALELAPENPEANFVSGLLNHYSAYDFDAALRDYETALQFAPYRMDVKINMAWLQWGLTNYDDARTTLLEVTELNPNNLDALYALSFLYYQAYGDPQQAIEPVTRCVDLDPTNRACLFYLGNVQRGLGNNAAALDAYRDLIDTGTENPNHFLAAARAYMDGAGDCDSARSLLQRGYEFELGSDFPNIDLLTNFEELLATCGAPVAPTAAPTVEGEATTQP
jgi:tetratricopeptide (TPR) repeat protein